MKLLKITNGLLETENFNSVSCFSDYLSKMNIEIKNNQLKINSNNKIEREIKYKEFLIEIIKDNWKDENIDIDDEFVFYVGGENGLYGIKDNKKNGQSNYQKIIYYDNYLQCYSSQDKKQWNNLGGIKDISINKQGFIKFSDKPIAIKNYRIYRNPYITIQNFTENTKVELYDYENNKLKTRVFDENNQCKIYLDYCIKGYLQFYERDNLFYESELMNLQYGDSYCFSEYELEVEYENVMLGDDPTKLKIEDIITLTDISKQDTYRNLKIYTDTMYDDEILLSLDGDVFNQYVIINEINPNERINIFTKINKGNMNHNFEYRDFELKLEQL